MRVANRIIVTLLSVVTIVVGIVFLATPTALLSNLAGTLNSLAVRIANPGSTRTVAFVAAVLVILIALAVIGLEVSPRRHKRVRIKAQGRGNASLRVESVAQTLAYRIDELEGVRKVVPDLFSHGKDVSVLLQVDVGPGVNIPALSDQIIDRTIRILEGELGLQIRGRVNLDISSEPYPEIKGVVSPVGAAVLSARPTMAPALDAVRTPGAGTPTVPMPEAPPTPAPATVISAPGTAPTTGAPQPPAWCPVPRVAGGTPESEAVEGRAPEPGATQAEAEGGEEAGPEATGPGEPPQERVEDPC